MDSTGIFEQQKLRIEPHVDGEAHVGSCTEVQKAGYSIVHYLLESSENNSVNYELIVLPYKALFIKYEKNINFLFILK